MNPAEAPVVVLPGEPAVTVAPEPAPPAAPTPLETVWARVMFALAAAFLLLAAGLIHRAQQAQVTEIELTVISIGLAVLWPVFFGEAVVGVLRRGPGRRVRPVLLWALVVVLLPPFRMGRPDPRTGLIWLPRLGWRPPGKDLYASLERAFSGPMIVFALLILPVLGLEYLQADRVRADPNLALAVHVGVATIWVAFATEFVLMMSAAPKPLVHLKNRWLDLAIVVLPMLEFVLTRWADAAPLARLLRLSRALSPEQITGMQRVYRLRGLLTKGWQAFLVLGGMGRLLGNVDEKRLRAVELEIEELEEELAALRKQADELRERIGR
jgi:hypothetical protein